MTCCPCCRSDGDLKSLRWYEWSLSAKKTGWCFGTWMLFFHTFPFSWECHHPNWRNLSFFRGVGSTTNQKTLSFYFYHCWTLADFRVTISATLGYFPGTLGWLGAEPPMATAKIFSNRYFLEFHGNFMEFHFTKYHSKSILNPHSLLQKTVGPLISWIISRCPVAKGAAISPVDSLPKKSKDRPPKANETLVALPCEETGGAAGDESVRNGLDDGFVPQVEVDFNDVNVYGIGLT